MTIFDLDNLDQYTFETKQELDLALAEIKESLKIVLQKDIPKIFSKFTRKTEELTESFFGRIDTDIRQALRVETFQEFTEASQAYGETAAAVFYEMQLQLSGLKTAAVQLAAPLMQALLPAVKTVSGAINQLASGLSQVMHTLFAGSQNTDALTESLQQATSGSKKLVRSLAGFDQITRLGDSSASGSVFSYKTVTELTGGWKKLADKLTEILTPLKNIDLTPAANSLNKLKTALEPITRALFAGLEWAWYNLFVPLAKWAAEHLLPVFLQTLTAALNALGTVIEALKPMFQWLWENFLKPLAEWAGNKIISGLQSLTDKLNGVSGWVGENQSPIEQILATAKNMVGTVAAIASGIMRMYSATNGATSAFDLLKQSVVTALNPFGSADTAVGKMSLTLSKLASAFGLVDSASGTAWSSIKGIWEKAWSWLKEKTVDPAYSGLKNTVNAIIGLINKMLSGFCAGVNTLSGAVNKLSFKVPEWVPLIGGKNFAFDLKTVTAPQIPYLAKGAVLPANKPFMAVVGDQRHGTNIEAPLTTIQEAVALVMQDQTAALLAGFETSVGVQRQILEAVLGITIGDDMIAAAAQRYNRKMAVLTGG